MSASRLDKETSSELEEGMVFARGLAFWKRWAPGTVQCWKKEGARPNHDQEELKTIHCGRGIIVKNVACGEDQGEDGEPNVQLTEECITGPGQNIWRTEAKCHNLILKNVFMVPGEIFCWNISPEVRHKNSWIR